MKLGFVIPLVGPAVSGAAGLSAFCRGLKDLGYDTLWVGDRLVTPADVDSSYLAHGPQMTRSLDPVLLWTVAAAATSRMRLNASTFYYEPPHLARLLTTLDVLSDGRLGVTGRRSRLAAGRCDSSGAWDSTGSPPRHRARCGSR